MQAIPEMTADCRDWQQFARMMSDAGLTQRAVEKETKANWRLLVRERERIRLVASQIPRIVGDDIGGLVRLLLLSLEVGMDEIGNHAQRQFSEYLISEGLVAESAGNLIPRISVSFFASKTILSDPAPSLSTSSSQSTYVGPPEESTLELYDFLPTGSNSYLDVGCGSGSLLVAARADAAVGWEISDRACQFASATIQLNDNAASVRKCDVNLVTLRDYVEKFDAIAFNAPMGFGDNFMMREHGYMGTGEAVRNIRKLLDFASSDGRVFARLNLELARGVSVTELLEDGFSGLRYRFTDLVDSRLAVTTRMLRARQHDTTRLFSTDRTGSADMYLESLRERDIERVAAVVVEILGPDA